MRNSKELVALFDDNVFAGNLKIEFPAKEVSLFQWITGKWKKNEAVEDYDEFIKEYLKWKTLRMKNPDSDEFQKQSDLLYKMISIYQGRFISGKFSLGDNTESLREERDEAIRLRNEAVEETVGQKLGINGEAKENPERKGVTPYG